MSRASRQVLAAVASRRSYYFHRATSPPQRSVVSPVFSPAKPSLWSPSSSCPRPPFLLSLSSSVCSRPRLRAVQVVSNAIFLERSKFLQVLLVLPVLLVTPRPPYPSPRPLFGPRPLRRSSSKSSSSTSSWRRFVVFFPECSLSGTFQNIPEIFGGKRQCMAQWSREGRPQGRLDA